jgi:hypothetical protein
MRAMFYDVHRQLRPKETGIEISEEAAVAERQVQARKGPRQIVVGTAVATP